MADATLTEEVLLRREFRIAFEIFDGISAEESQAALLALLGVSVLAELKFALTSAQAHVNACFIKHLSACKAADTSKLVRRRIASPDASTYVLLRDALTHNLCSQSVLVMVAVNKFGMLSNSFLKQQMSIIKVEAEIVMNKSKNSAPLSTKEQQAAVLVPHLLIAVLPDDEEEKEAFVKNVKHSWKKEIKELHALYERNIKQRKINDALCLLGGRTIAEKWDGGREESEDCFRKLKKMADNDNSTHKANPLWKKINFYDKMFARLVSSGLAKSFIKRSPEQVPTAASINESSSSLPAAASPLAAPCPDYSTNQAICFQFHDQTGIIERAIVNNHIDLPTLMRFHDFRDRNELIGKSLTNSYVDEMTKYNAPHRYKSKLCGDHRANATGVINNEETISKYKRAMYPFVLALFFFRGNDATISAIELSNQDHLIAFIHREVLEISAGSRSYLMSKIIAYMSTVRNGDAFKPVSSLASVGSFCAAINFLFRKRWGYEYMKKDHDSQSNPSALRESNGNEEIDVIHNRVVAGDMNGPACRVVQCLLALAKSVSSGNMPVIEKNWGKEDEGVSVGNEFIEIRQMRAYYHIMRVQLEPIIASCLKKVGIDVDLLNGNGSFVCQKPGDLQQFKYLFQKGSGNEVTSSKSMITLLKTFAATASEEDYNEWFVEWERAQWIAIAMLGLNGMGRATEFDVALSAISFVNQPGENIPMAYFKRYTDKVRGMDRFGEEMFTLLSDTLAIPMLLFTCLNRTILEGKGKQLSASQKDRLFIHNVKTSAFSQNFKKQIVQCSVAAGDEAPYSNLPFGARSTRHVFQVLLLKARSSSSADNDDDNVERTTAGHGINTAHDYADTGAGMSLGCTSNTLTQVVQLQKSVIAYLELDKESVMRSRRMNVTGVMDADEGHYVASKNLIELMRLKANEPSDGAIDALLSSKLILTLLEGAGVNFPLKSFQKSVAKEMLLNIVSNERGELEDGRKNMAVLVKTGSGKTLPLMLLSLVMSLLRPTDDDKKIIVIIVPTIRLIEQYMDSCVEWGVNFVRVEGSHSECMERVEAKKPTVLLSVADSAVSDRTSDNILKQLAERKKLLLIACDEAHDAVLAVNFRPCYTMLKILLHSRELKSNMKVILSATVPPALKKVTYNAFGMKVDDSVKVVMESEELSTRCKDVEFEASWKIDALEEAAEVAIEQLKRKKPLLIIVPTTKSGVIVRKRIVELLNCPTSNHLIFVNSSDFSGKVGTKNIDDWKEGDKLICISTAPFPGVNMLTLSKVILLGCYSVFDFAQHAGRTARKEGMEGFVSLWYDDDLKKYYDDCFQKSQRECKLDEDVLAFLRNTNGMLQDACLPSSEVCARKLIGAVSEREDMRTCAQSRSRGCSSCSAAALKKRSAAGASNAASLKKAKLATTAHDKEHEQQLLNLSIVEKKNADIALYAASVWAEVVERVSTTSECIVCGKECCGKRSDSSQSKYACINYDLTERGECFNCFEKDCNKQTCTFTNAVRTKLEHNKNCWVCHVPMCSTNSHKMSSSSCCGKFRLGIHRVTACGKQVLMMMRLISTKHLEEFRSYLIDNFNNEFNLPQDCDKFYDFYKWLYLSNTLSLENLKIGNYIFAWGFWEERLTKAKK
jgi:hypothetical protein